MWSKTIKQPRADCSVCFGTGLQDDPKDMLCNLCGKAMCPKVDKINPNHFIPHGLYKAKVSGGYESWHLLDMNLYVFSSCEECLRKLFNKCKIKPQVSSFHEMNYSYEDDKESYDYRIWKDKGFHHKAYLNKKCNRKKNCRRKAVYSIFINGEFSEETSCENHKFEDGGSYTFMKYISPKLKILL